MPRLKLSAAFAEAVLHDEHVVLGRRLDPFCLEHWIALDQLKSPLIHGGPVTITDLRLAVTVCSTRNNADFKRFWVAPRWHEKLWQKLTAKSPAGPLLAEWNRYVDDHYPQFPRQEDLSAEPPAPSKCPSLILACARLVRLGQDEAKVRRMALGLVIAWCIALTESEGIDDTLLLSDRDIDDLAEIEAERQAKEAGHGG